jgi:hypothetical protein
VRDTYQVREAKRAEQCLEFRTGKTIGSGVEIWSLSGAFGRPNYAGELTLHIGSA